jgi:hypothetical protein
MTSNKNEGAHISRNDGDRLLFGSHYQNVGEDGGQHSNSGRRERDTARLDSAARSNKKS